MIARMRCRSTSILALLVALTGLGPSVCAEDPAASPQSLPSPQVLPTPQQPNLVIPPGLPRYDLAVRIDPQNRKVKARERIVFTNRSKVPVNELIFHVYPRYKVPDKDRIKLAKTMEVLRLSPEEALDTAGQRMEVSRVFVGNL